MKVVHGHGVSGDVWIGQSGYLVKCLERFGMQDAKSVVTSVDRNTKLVKVSDNNEIFY